MNDGIKLPNLPGDPDVRGYVCKNIFICPNYYCAVLCVHHELAQSKERTVAPLLSQYTHVNRALQA
jgi:hypothetical protein